MRYYYTAYELWRGTCWEWVFDYFHHARRVDIYASVITSQINPPPRVTLTIQRTFQTFAPPFFNSAITSLFRVSGLVVLAHLPTTFPSLPTKNFSKFHLIRFMPIKPGFSFFIHSQTGSALSPFTSTFPRTGNETP
jgi:hypothetical protein